MTEEIRTREYFVVLHSCKMKFQCNLHSGLRWSDKVSVLLHSVWMCHQKGSWSQGKHRKGKKIKNDNCALRVYAFLDFSFLFCSSSSSNSLCMHSNSITFHYSHYDIWALEAHILSCSQPSERHTNLCICRIAGHRCLVTFLLILLSLKCQDCLSGFSVIFAELAYLDSCDDVIAHIYKLASR